MKILRTASQGSNLSCSYKERVYSLSAFVTIHMKCFLSPTSSAPIVYILNLNTEGETLNNKYCK